MSIIHHTTQRIDPREDALAQTSTAAWLKRQEWHRDALVSLAEAVLPTLPGMSAQRRNGFASLQVAFELSSRGALLSAADLLLAALNDRSAPRRVDRLYRDRIDAIVSALERDVACLLDLKQQSLTRSPHERSKERILASALSAVTRLIAEYRELAPKHHDTALRN